MIVVQTDTKAPHHHSEAMFQRNCFHCCLHFLVQDIGIALKSSANLRGRLSRREPLWEERATKTMVFRAEPPILPHGPPTTPFGPPSHPTPHPHLVFGRSFSPPLALLMRSNVFGVGFVFTPDFGARWRRVNGYYKFPIKSHFNLLFKVIFLPYGQCLFDYTLHWVCWSSGVDYIDK